MKTLVKTSGRGGYIHLLDNNGNKSLCGFVGADWRQWEIVERTGNYLDIPQRERCLLCTQILTPKPKIAEVRNKTKRELAHEIELEKLARWKAG